MDTVISVQATFETYDKAQEASVSIEHAGIDTKNISIAAKEGGVHAFVLSVSGTLEEVKLADDVLVAAHPSHTIHGEAVFD